MAPNAGSTPYYPLGFPLEGNNPPPGRPKAGSPPVRSDPFGSGAATRAAVERGGLNSQLAG